MLSDQYVFTQLMTFLPKHEFRSCVQRYRGDRRIRNFCVSINFSAWLSLN